jgi:predicted HicB family RNase H-like nuclease
MIPRLKCFGVNSLNQTGGADFYAKDIESLKKEGAISLKVFLDACKNRNIEPKKKYSGKFNVHVPSDLHANIAIAAMAEGKSFNQWIVDTLEHAVHI